MTKQRPDLVTLIAIYHFIVAALSFLALCALLLAFFTIIFAFRADTPLVPLIPAAILVVVMAFVGAALLANVVVGWGLLALQPWARWAAIALSILRLLNFPIGTIIGGLIIWYLFTPEGRAVFEAAE